MTKEILASVACASGQGVGISVPNLAAATSGSYNGTTSGINAGNSNFPAFGGGTGENSLGNVGTVSGTISGLQTYTAGQTLSAPPTGQTNIIATAANVTYQSGNSVLLQPGFQTQAGAVFKAKLGGCY